MEDLGTSASYFPLILSGDRGSGKSRLCESLLAEAGQTGIAAGGVICPGIFDSEGVKTGCRALDARTGKTMEFGSRTQDLHGPRFKAWTFAQDAMDFANRAVANAIAAQAGLVFLDEAGPLELENGGGLSPALGNILAACGSISDNYRGLAVICVRPSLESALCAMFASKATVRLDGRLDRKGLALSDFLAIVPEPEAGQRP